MSDDKFDAPALVKEAREYADAEQAIYESAKIGEKPEERAGSNMELFGELASALESLSARVTQAEARAKRWEDLAVQSAEELNALNERRAIEARWTAAVGERARIALSPGTGNEASE